MSCRPARSDEPSACLRCRRRSWLVSELSPPLGCRRGRQERLRELLVLPDAQLIDALAGKRRASLRDLYGEYRPGETEDTHDHTVLCRHQTNYPQGLKDEAPPAALWIESRAPRLDRLLDAPAVAILGSQKPSEYGTRTASRLARGLAASGVTVIAGTQSGIAAAAHQGALQLRVGPVAVAADGLGHARRGPRSALFVDVANTGCVLSELPPNACGRVWGRVTSERVLLGLAALVILVEAEDGSKDLATARFAIELGMPVAAVPGHVDSPLAFGPHSLLLEGAKLVRDPEDILELLCQHENAAPAMA